MKNLEVGSFEAKNKLSELLSKVEKGQRIFITRRGKRVAILMSPESIDPAGGAHDGPSLMEEIRSFRAIARSGPEPLRQLIEEGRR
jgi:prevent-host-death family protein